jgi:uncharacterized protein
MAFSFPDFIEINLSGFGRGLFAKRSISANTIICGITGPELDFNATLLLGERESHCLQTGINKYILCDPPFLYSNHSCHPNCAINGELFFYTIKEIKKGEELVWDYSTSMLERHWQMNCSCGYPGCRKIIKDFDLLPEMVQQHYIKIQIVMPFILEAKRTKQNEFFSRA